MQRWQFPINNSTLKALSDQVYDLDINALVNLSCLFSFAVSLQKWLVDFLFISSAMEKLTEINTFQVIKLKTTVSPPFLIRFRFHMHYSFSRSKYFHLLIAPIEGFVTLLDNENKKIYVIPILFLLVQNKQQTHDWTMIGSGAYGLGIQECSKDRYS